MISYPLVNDELALLWMVNMACIDMNAWYSRVDRPERPDFVLFDLDPSPDVGFPETVEVALLVRAMLDGIGLKSYAKTSGADGIHVLVPIERRWTYADTREFAEIVARALVSTHRGLVTTEWQKAKRRGVLIDSNQNGEGKTIASAYSVRPKEGAPVSTPLRWDEVNASLDPSAFTMEVVLERIEKQGDLFEGVLTEKQSLSKALAAVPLDRREDSYSAVPRSSGDRRARVARLRVREQGQWAGLGRAPGRAACRSEFVCRSVAQESETLRGAKPSSNRIRSPRRTRTTGAEPGPLPQRGAMESAQTDRCLAIQQYDEYPS